MNWNKWLLVIAVIFMSGILFAQQRFGDEFRLLKGFTKSPTEHIMNEHEGIPELRAVRGQVVASGVGIPNVVFELRNENPDDIVRGVTTNSKGEFRLGSVRDGVYVFKVTLDGFQSVYGKLKVTGKAKPEEMLRIDLNPGV